MTLIPFNSVDPGPGEPLPDFIKPEELFHLGPFVIYSWRELREGQFGKQIALDVIHGPKHARECRTLTMKLNPWRERFLARLLELPVGSKVGPLVLEQKLTSDKKGASPTWVFSEWAGAAGDTPARSTSGLDAATETASTRPAQGSLEATAPVVNEEYPF